MTGFAAEWLALREPADAAARSAALAARAAARLASRLTDDARRAVVDLGCGTGANLRYLAPRLGGAEDWWLVDDDPALLARCERQASRAVKSARSVRTARLDLATGLRSLALPTGALVTASALLDLVSASWLETLAERCAAASADVLFALTYDGAVELLPREPEDERVRELVNRHQQRDKGFGPALGPAAAGHAAAIFEAAGYRVETARSDWRLGAEQGELQAALLAGWRSAAAEVEPEWGGRLEEWLRRRMAHVVGGRSALRVGHTDLLGLLDPRAPARAGIAGLAMRARRRLQ